jgi:UPF0716 protein FxsA
VLVIFGGAFLITPGFITDLVGVLLLVPPTRAVFRRFAVRRLGRRMAVQVTDTRRRPDFDVDGTASEHHAPPGRLER